jgi:hypothetical protein
MTGNRWTAGLAAALAIIALSEGTAYAQKTDVVTLANGDRITGEVSKLDRGRLEYKTDDAGTINIEWDKIVSLQAKGQFEVWTIDGQQYFGSLGVSPSPRTLVVVELVSQVSVTLGDVVEINPIGMSFWKKLDGSLDLGFSYTKSSDIAQLNFNSTTVYRRPAFEGRLGASATLTQSGDDSGRDDRGSIQASYTRYRGARLYVAGGVGFETNESLGLALRSQVVVAVGQRLINTNQAQFSYGGGIAANDERGVDTGATQNLEGLATLRYSYYRYDSPKTNVDVGFQYYPSFSNWGRQRIQVDSSVRREILNDVFVSINVFDSFDSRPPNPSADTNDIGVVLSFGWSY